MVGSDKERPKGRVGSGSDNARGSTILKGDVIYGRPQCPWKWIFNIFFAIFARDTRKYILNTPSKAESIAY